MVDHALRHRERALPDGDRQPQLALGSIAPQTHWGDRSRRSLASAALPSPALTALSSARVRPIALVSPVRRAGRIGRRPGSCSAASISHCRTVFGSPSNPRAVPRMPRPSARHAMTRTMISTEVRVPGKSVPRSRENSRDRRYTAAAARDRHGDGPWRGDCPSRPSRARHSLGSGRNGVRGRPHASALAWARCGVAELRGSVGEGHGWMPRRRSAAWW